MSEENVKLLCNGIASISDALDVPFMDVLEDLVDIGTLETCDKENVLEHMESF